MPIKTTWSPIHGQSAEKIPFSEMSGCATPLR